MNLGIVVGYQVREGNERLLDLHLGMIDRHTRVPYTIYGTANKLPHHLREKLAAHPHLTLCDFPTSDQTGSLEHSYYLDRLVKVAIAAGVSHVVTLHVDSFPIRSDWVEVLGEALSRSCAFAGVVIDDADRKPNTSCLFFPREFYLEHRPTFRLTDAERMTEPYERYRQKFPHKWDSGVGYGFKAFSAGLTWHPLLRSNKGRDRFGIANIYGDLIFHLGGAIRFTQPGPRPAARAKRPSLANMIRQHGWADVLRRAVMKAIPRPIARKIYPEYYETPQEVLARATQQLLADPEAFLDRLC